MATAAKFAGAEREKLFAQLEVPFDPAQVKWRVMRIPTRDEIQPIANEQAVVEFYSR